MHDERVRCPICREEIVVRGLPGGGAPRAFLARLRARLDALGGHVIGWLLTGRED